MTTASPKPSPPLPAIQATRPSSNVEDDTPEADAAAAAAAAAAEQTLPPSKQDPPEDECVLCAYPLPLKTNESLYKSCCGELICGGCIIAQKRTLIIGTNVKKPIKGSREEEQEFRTMLTSKRRFVCPFCRKPEPTNIKETLKRLYNQIDNYKDPKAINLLGTWYHDGIHGRPKNLKKAEELFQQAYDLGNPYAAFNLARLYHEHIPDEARMKQYAEEGVRRGNPRCMSFLAIRAHQSGNWADAYVYYMMAARSGDDMAMNGLMEFYRNKTLTKDDLATTLRAHKAATDKGKSEPREYANRCFDFRKRIVAER